MNNILDNLINIKIIIGSIRKGRFSEKPAYWIFDKMKSFEEIKSEILDLKNYSMPFFDDSALPAMKQTPHENEIVRNWAEKINQGDAFVFVMPEYNHGYPAVLKNALDWLYYEWNKKPVSFISYGGAMGVRSVEQLKQVVINLQMVPIINSVHIQGGSWMLNEEGELNEGFFNLYEKAAKEMIEELLWWAKALKKMRQKV